jgi:hypothetical protein
VSASATPPCDVAHTNGIRGNGPAPAASSFSDPRPETKDDFIMRYPWLGIPFAAPRSERATDHRPRPARAPDRPSRAMLAAPAVALAAWLGVLTVAIAGEDSSRGDRSVVPRDTGAAGDPVPRPGRAGPGAGALR